MSGHGPPGGEETLPASGLAKIANSIESFIRPIYTWLGYLGGATLCGLVLVMFYSILARRFFNAPLQGSTELTQLGLVLIIAFVFGIEHIGHEKMTVDIVIKRFPKKMQAVIAPIIFILGVAILCVVVWQLIKLGNTYRGAGQTLRNIRTPIYPFTYLLALGVFTLIPVYFVRFLRALGEVVKR